MNASLVLFAQQNRPPDGAAAAAGVMAFAFICGYVVLLIGALALEVWFLLSAYKALSAVSPRNRDMEPAMIFLIFIPFFGIVWYFFIVIRIADSFQKEYEERGMQPEGDFGKLFGILGRLIPCIGWPILYIMWIMKIRSYTAALQAGGRGRKRIRDEDDEDDDRPRKKKRRREEDEDDD